MALLAKHISVKIVHLVKQAWILTNMFMRAHIYEKIFGHLKFQNDGQKGDRFQDGRRSRFLSTAVELEFDKCDRF